MKLKMTLGNLFRETNSFLRNNGYLGLLCLLVFAAHTALIYGLTITGFSFLKNFLIVIFMTAVMSLLREARQNPKLEFTRALVKPFKEKPGQVLIIATIFIVLNFMGRINTNLFGTSHWLITTVFSVLVSVFMIFLLGWVPLSIYSIVNHSLPVEKNIQAAFQLYIRNWKVLFPFDVLVMLPLLVGPVAITIASYRFLGTPDAMEDLSTFHGIQTALMVLMLVLSVFVNLYRTLGFHIFARQTAG